VFFETRCALEDEVGKISIGCGSRHKGKGVDGREACERIGPIRDGLAQRVDQAARTDPFGESYERDS
jgi:hypothetical protein